VISHPPYIPCHPGQLFQVAAFEQPVAVRGVLRNDAVPAVPGFPGRRVQPDYPRRVFPDLRQVFRAGRFPVVAGVSQDQYRGPGREAAQVLVVEFPPHRAVVAEGRVTDAGPLSDLKQRLPDIPLFQVFRYLGYVVHEGEGAHPGESFLHRVDQLEHEAGEQGDRSGQVA